MKVLVLISPPVSRGPVPQCIAIQAHQPDILHLVQPLYPKQKSSTVQSKRIQAWIKDPSALMAMFPVVEPFPVPLAAPRGYLSLSSEIPEIHFHSVPIEQFSQTLRDIAKIYPNNRVIFDMLPGGKEPKLQALIIDSETIDLAYSLESGKTIDVKSGEVYGASGVHVPLVDRFWLSGEPVAVDLNFEDIERQSAFYSAVEDALSVEVLTPRKEHRLINARSKNGKIGKIKPRDKFDRPISMFDISFREAFSCEGVFLKSAEDGSDDVEFRFADGTKKMFPELIQGAPNGSALEPVITNLLHKYWPVFDSLTGVSVVYGESQQRCDSYQKHTERQREDWIKGLNVTYLMRCKAVGLDPEATLPNDLMFQEMEAVREERLSPMTLLPWVRQVEIDTVCLTPSGVLSFDAKAFIAKLQKDQTARQKPSSLFGNRKEGQYYIVCSTSPDSTLNLEPVIHISQLKYGHQVLRQTERHEWQPSGRLGAELRRAIMVCFEERLQAQPNTPEEFVTQLTEKAGARRDVLSRILFIDPWLGDFELLKHIAQTAPNLRRKFLEVCHGFLDTIESEIIQQVSKEVEKWASEANAKVQRNYNSILTEIGWKTAKNNLKSEAKKLTVLTELKSVPSPDYTAAKKRFEKAKMERDSVAKQRQEALSALREQEKKISLHKDSVINANGDLMAQIERTKEVIPGVGEFSPSDIIIYMVNNRDEIRHFLLAEEE